MYTLRDDADKDFAATVKKVAEIGYAGVELAGHGGLTVPELRILLEDSNLKVSGSHVSLDAFEADINKVIDENLELGNPSVVIPYISDNLRDSADAYRKIAEKLNSFGEKTAAAGLTLGYHNHDFEFKTFDDGDFGLKILIDNTSPELVSFELDTYWVLVAGQDPVAYIASNQDRINLLHIKDRNPEDGSFAEVGTGNLPLDAIVALASAGGRVKWLIVEQDVCKNAPIDAVTTSFNNLKARGYA
jgi:sugar phosphate isomerase/epimerase